MKVGNSIPKRWHGPGDGKKKRKSVGGWGKYGAGFLAREKERKPVKGCGMNGQGRNEDERQ
jgi:hypothetical protein